MMRTRCLACFAFGVLWVSGCGGSDADGSAAGGAPSTTGSGGSAAASGGATTASGGASTAGGSANGGRSQSATGGSAMGGTSAGGTTATGGSAGSPGSGGTSLGGASGTSGGSGGNSGGSSGSAGSGGSTSGLSLTPSEGVWSYPRTAAGPTQSFQLRNGGSSTLAVNLAITGTHAAAFEIASGATAMVAAGASAPVEVRFRPDKLANSGATAAPPADDGGVTVDALLSASVTGGSSAQLSLFGLALTVAGSGAGSEATLGQSLKTLGYNINVGNGLRDHLKNSVEPTPLQGEEVSMPRFVKAGEGPVVLKVVARFSPSGAMPYGYYTAAAPNCPNTTNCVTVGSMTTNADANTSNGSRMLNPPVDAAGMTGSFDPGSASFGIWAYTDQASQKVSTGGDASYGDYAYTESALNLPANRHRMRVFPLRNRAGALIPNSYLVGCEEAANGDYQDYVFTISNVKKP